MRNHPSTDKALVTLKQIGNAFAPALSAKTVSLALRGDPAVSKELATRIQAKALALGYIPRRSRDATLGIIVPYLSHPTYTELLATLRAFAAARGAITLTGESTGNLEAERRLVSTFSQRGVEGLILISPRMAPAEIHQLARASQPIVTVFLPIQAQEYHFGSVELNNALGATLAVSYLIEQGFRRVVYLAGRQTSASDMQRRQGYQDALAQAAITYEKPLTVEIGWGVTLPWPSFDTGYWQCQQLLERRMKPEAIFAYNDMTALGAMRALHERGIRVPQDIAVIGFDNVPFSQFCIPALTTVGVQRDDIAANVIELLFQAAGSATPAANRHRILLPDLIIRESAIPSP